MNEKLKNIFSVGIVAVGMGFIAFMIAFVTGLHLDRCLEIEAKEWIIAIIGTFCFLGMMVAFCFSLEKVGCIVREYISNKKSRDCRFNKWNVK